jgi:glycosyltransferase involved in cell wall biosynthesis
MDLDRYGWLDRVNFFLTCRLSRMADLIIANSESGRRYHVERGYPAATTRTIRNGIDTQRFQRDPEGRARVRAEWGIRDDQVLVGMVGRLDLMKDHPVFLEAAARVALRRANVRFVCVGSGEAKYQESLARLGEQLGLGDRLRWAGPRTDMPAVYSALDLHVSTSYGEGLSNVVAEAMACEVPAVATDVGDSAWILGSMGPVIPPKHAEKLAEAMDSVLVEAKSDTQSLRRRIIDHLSVSALVATTEQALKSVAKPAQFDVCEGRPELI